MDYGKIAKKLRKGAGAVRKEVMGSAKTIAGGALRMANMADKSTLTGKMPLGSRLMKSGLKDMGEAASVMQGGGRSLAKIAAKLRKRK